MDVPTPEIQQRLHEVSDELLKIYKLLINLRFIDPEALIVGPHKIDDKLLAKYKKCGLDPAIIYLYSIMPYIDEMETTARDFFQGCGFFNPLKIRDVQEGRDPRYLMPEGGFNDEEGPYMRSFFTPLSTCSNHSPIMIYDAREHRIWIIDQIDGRTTDPALCKWYPDTDSAKEKTWGDSGSSNWSGDDSSEDDTDFSDDESHGSSEFWDDEDALSQTRELDNVVEDQAEVEIDYDEGFEHVEELDESERQEAAAIKNNNSLELVRSRPAIDVLCDIQNWYRSLQETPGHGEHNGDWPRSDILRPLYLQNGWPDSFNPENFEVDFARSQAAKEARYSAEQPLREVECYEGWCEGSIEDIKRRKQELSEARTVENEWRARFELWKAEERAERNQRDLQHTRDKANTKCPGGVCQKDADLPLWEMEQLRIWTESGRKKVQQNERSTMEQFKDNQMARRHFEFRHRRDRKELAINEKAFAASKADAERMRPGRKFEEVVGHESLSPHTTLTMLTSQKDGLEESMQYLRLLREFAVTVPRGAPDALAAVEREVKDMEDSLVRSREQIARSEKWLAEHGNTI